MGMKLNLKQVAEMFDRSMGTAEKWLANGMPVEVQGSRGKAHVFDSMEVIRWWFKEQLPDGGVEGSKDSEIISKRRKMAADAELAEIKLNKEKGLLVDIADIEDVVSHEYKLLRANLLKLPGSMSARLAEEFNDPSAASEINAILVDEISAALSELQADKKYAKEQKTIKKRTPKIPSGKFKTTNKTKSG